MLNTMLPKEVRTALLLHRVIQDDLPAVWRLFTELPEMGVPGHSADMKTSRGC